MLPATTAVEGVMAMVNPCVIKFFSVWKKFVPRSLNYFHQHVVKTILGKTTWYEGLLF
jgi:hypothetical protein